ncbi:MAG: MATE family efflux transporter [Corynebacterium sp.]|nr:MATE family efflux transporter [Corynebacterium sp.]
MFSLLVQILRLAIPALGVLIATPLYLLLDTAVVGHLGGVNLAALGAASVIQTVVTTQLTFLSYGTTARSSHHFGAGRRDKAIYEGLQATWVALGVGIVLALIIAIGSPIFTHFIADDPEVAHLATQWLRHACPVIPAALIVMAGNGWMRGVQNTTLPLIFTLAGVIPAAICVPLFVHRYGIIGSAWANVLGEGIIAALFLITLIIQLAKHCQGYSYLPQWTLIKEQLRLGVNLIARSLGMQVALLTAATVAGRFGANSLGAHQLLNQVWSFLTLVLDSIAIAAQALVGGALGAKDTAKATTTGRMVIQISTGLGILLAIIMGATHNLIPQIFTNDPAIIATTHGPWICLLIMLVLGGVVFALDGVLLGAADAAFLRNATIAAVLIGYIPGAVAALIFDWGLPGVWGGLIAFLLIRLIAGAWRFHSGAWTHQWNSQA